MQLHSYEKWQIDAFKAMPLSYHCVAMEITNRCTAQCSICYQHTEKLNSLNAIDLPEKEAKLAISDASQSTFLYKRFHLAGGEAFLDLDKCIRLFEHAKKVGFFEITATTNAFWAKNFIKARKVAESLRRAGLSGLEVSTDYWHQQYIHPSAIDNCMRACKEFGIKIILRILSTKTHTMGETFKSLQPKTLQLSDMIVCGNVFLTGKAVEEVKSYEVRPRFIDFPCHSILNLAINARGAVTPCCAGLDQSCLNFGNIKDTSLHDIINLMNKSQIARILAFFGTSFFLPILHQSGIYKEKKEKFTTACELCSAIFSNHNHIIVIENYLKNLQRQSILEAISYLRREREKRLDTSIS